MRTSLRASRPADSGHSATVAPAQDGRTGASDNAKAGSSGFSAPTVTKPTGGGALHGIGEKFQTNLNSGTVSLEIPLKLPSGRGELGPGLSLQYSSGNGNSAFGMGWTVAVPIISRRVDKGVPRYDDSDVFVLAGAEDLVLVPADPATVTISGIAWRVFRYRPRVEAGFQRIEHWMAADGSVSQWRITDRSNITSVFGSSDESRIADPADARRIFSWLLAEMRDDRGNVVVYRYKAEDGASVDPLVIHEHQRFSGGNGRFLAGSQRYLKSVLYGNKTTPRDLSQGSRFTPIPSSEVAAWRWCFHVVFDYGEHGADGPSASGSFETVVRYGEGGAPWACRPDPFSTCRPGFEVRTYRRCQRVLVFHQFDELGPEPVCVSQQLLSYDESAHLSRLVAFECNGLVRERGDIYRGDRDQAAPPLLLKYTDAGAAITRVIAQNDENGQAASAVTGEAYRWVDLDGEGIPGALWTADDEWRYRRNLGGGVLAAPVPVKTLPSDASLDGGDLQLLDVDADGRLELAQFAPPAAGFYSRTAGADWTRRQLFESVPQFDLSDPNLRFVDLTGDGLADILITRDDALVWLQSLGSKGFAAARRRLLAADEEAGPRGLFANAEESLLLADMSGDGLVDLVRIRNGSVCYWPNLGHGGFGSKVTLGGGYLFDANGQFDPQRIRLADVDGSGTTDIIYLAHDRAFIYANQSGNSLRVPAREVDLPRVDKLTHVDAIDVLGKGTACLVWSSAGPGTQKSALHVIDLAGGIKPHLLCRMDNGFGGSTHIDYTTSATQYLADRAAGKAWLTRLAFPMHVVARVVKADAVAGTELTTTYAYRHGYYDGREREFRGFGFVEQRDAETLPAQPGMQEEPEYRPAAVIRTWFHTGAWMNGRRQEQLFAEEYFDGGAAAARRQTDQWPSCESARELREMSRALKGKPLRIETYAEEADSSIKPGACPYAVTEYIYSTPILQAGSVSAPAVVQVRTDETLQFHYEQDAGDPRITHELTLEFDAFGHPTRRATVAYARRGSAAVQGQKHCLATLTESIYVNDASSATRFRLGIPCGEVRYVLPGLALPPAGGVWQAHELGQVIDSLPELPLGAPEAPDDGAVGKRLLAASCFSYWDDALSDADLPIGQVGARALPCHRYDLAFNDRFVPSNWPAGETLADLLEKAQAELGYVRSPMCDQTILAGFPLPSGVGLWWRPSGRLRPDPGLFFAAREYVDAFGARTGLRHDRDGLLLVETHDPRGNTTTADIDYRVLGANRLTDPNGNVTAFAYEPNGKLQAAAMLGKGEGDTLQEPTLEYRYAMRTMGSAAGMPMHVRTFEREQHVNARAYPSTVRRVRVEYTDGSGRPALTMVEAEPGDAPILDNAGELQPAPDRRSVLTGHVGERWVGTGRIIYDNKGNPVRKYEPFFWPDSAFPVRAALRQWGVSPALHYDALNRLVRTDNPDGSCSCVRYFAWHTERWDENDTVLHAPVSAPGAPKTSWYERMLKGSPLEREAAEKVSAHAATPHTEWLDPLGRPCAHATPEYDPERARRDGKSAPFVYTTRHTLDIDGRVLQITDATDRVVAHNSYDLLGRALTVWLADAGMRWQLSNAGDQPAREWSERGIAWRILYDALRRPTHRYVRWPEADDARDPVRPLRNGGNARSPAAQQHRGREVLAERLYYGEDIARQEARDANLLGQAAAQFDDAGLLHFTRYDFKGNLTDQSRQLTAAFRSYADWSDISRVADRYQARARVAHLLDEHEFRTVDLFDARSRLLERRAPDASLIRHTYNAAGLLESVVVQIDDGSAPRTVIDNIDYNARGQRVRIVYGQAGAGRYRISTRYTYDPLTFRLQELCSWRDGMGGHPYQQLAYTYDPVGNITAIVNGGAKRTFAWNAGAGIVDGNQAFRYDALYQLIEASGRERPNANRAHDDPLRDQVAHPADLTALQRYTEQFEYDRNGNLIRTRHAAGAGGWTLAQTYDTASNRMRSVGAGPGSETYQHDAHGNLVVMPHLALMDWDAEDRLKLSARNGGQLVWFSYDGNGQRIRKVFEADGTLDETVYIGGCEFHTRRTGRRLRETSTLRVSDGAQSVAILDTVIADDFGELEAGSAMRFQLTDHLGSVTVECNESGAAVSYEEFRAFGTTAFSASSSVPGASRRRYRFSGKERDEETGLQYFGARYYAPWASRWISCDPLMHRQERSPVAEFCAQAYVYVNNRPSVTVDPDGRLPQVVVGAAIGAVLGAAVEVGVQYAAGASLTKDGINWRSVAAAATAGAVGGALAGATFGASLLVAKGVAAGAADAVAGVAGRAVAGEGGRAIGVGAVQDFAVGVATFGLMHGGSRFIKVIGASPVGKKIETALERAATIFTRKAPPVVGTRGAAGIPNLTERGTLSNLEPLDAVVAQRPVRTLVQDESGRYWLQSRGGNRITPSGSYDFVTLPNGAVKVARKNQVEALSTHLGLSGGEEVKYAGSIRFGHNEGANRGAIIQWTNASGHYKPPPELSSNAGLPDHLFRPIR